MSQSRPYVAAGGHSTFVCDDSFLVDNDSVELSSLAVDGQVTCMGNHVVEVSDVENLERKSTATVTAVDKFDLAVRDTASMVVALKQVWSCSVTCSWGDEHDASRMA